MSMLEVWSKGEHGLLRGLESLSQLEQRILETPKRSPKCQPAWGRGA